MSQTDIKSTHPVGTSSADRRLKELEEKILALPRPTAEALEAAFDLISTALAQREISAERAGDALGSQRFWAGSRALSLVQSALRDETLLNDFLFNVHDLREALAAMPPWNPDEDDAWVQKQTNTEK
ncbi:MAG: hypothetical protein JXB47_14905 [Anaerolineae bacterium]|nr:hypothetical protein [Anaerolineae bacterium]